MNKEKEWHYEKKGIAVEQPGTSQRPVITDIIKQQGMGTSDNY
jgi:hypothetical protein